MLVEAVAQMGTVRSGWGALSEAESPGFQAVGPQSRLLNRRVAGSHFARWGHNAGLRGLRLRRSRTIFTGILSRGEIR